MVGLAPSLQVSHTKMISHDRATSSGCARFAGGLTEIGPGVHGWLQPNGLLGESNAGS